MDGLTFEYISENEGDFLYEEIFVKQSYFTHVSVGSDSKILDIGSNIGLFTLYCCLTFEMANIIAIEPIPPIFDVLRRNITSFREKVFIYNIGIGTLDSISEFSYFEHQPGESTRWPEQRNSQRQKLYEEQANYAKFLQQHQLISSDPELIVIERDLSGDVEGKCKSNSSEENIFDFLKSEDTDGVERYCCPIWSLEKVILESGWDVVDLLKIDVEGDELLALQSLRSCWGRVRQIVVEVHDIDGRLSEVLHLLSEEGFRTIVEQQKPEVSEDGLFVRFIPESLRLYLVHAIRDQY